MFCKVCSREINAVIFETIGNQIVCSLACVGLLQSNEEDKCNECQRPVWKDNYYQIDSLFYCSERCKKKVVKNHLKKFNTLQNVNIRHIENEYFKNDSPMKNLKELRKEVKEFYQDFDMDETAIIKSIPISCKSTFNYQDFSNDKIKIVDNENKKENMNNMSITHQSNHNKILSLKKYIKKYPAIPNRLSKNSSFCKNKSFYNDKRNISRNDFTNSNLTNSKSKAYNPEFEFDYKKMYNKRENTENNSKNNIISKVRLNRAGIYFWFCFVRRGKNKDNVLLDEGMDLISKRLDVFNLFDKMNKAEQRNEPLLNKTFSMTDECKRGLNLVRLETKGSGSSNGSDI